MNIDLLKQQNLLKVLVVFILVGFISCKKKETSIGLNNIDPNSLLNSVEVDTFSLNSYTEIEDSAITSNPVSALLGSYNDPVFGTFKAGFYTQFRLPAVNPTFGDVSSIKIDSFVLGLQYAGYYGDLSSQKVEVFELKDTLSPNTTYYSFSEKNRSSENLIKSTTFTPDPISQIVIDTTHVKAQLRLYVDTNLARNLINEAANNPTTFSSNENFLKYFKGLYVGVNNGNQLTGTGGILYFNLDDPLSKMTIYYHQDGNKKTYDFLINTSCAKFNNVQIDNSGKMIENAFENSLAGKTQFYAQAFKSRAIVKIPGIKNLPKKSIIHEAQLILPVELESLSKYTTGTEVSISTRLEDGTLKLYNIGKGVYDESTKQFIVDLKTYVQAVISNERYPISISGTIVNALISGTEIYISPRLFNTSADRIVFNGTNTSNNNKPKLTIKYTKF